MKKKLGPAVAAFCALMLIAAWRLHGKVLAIVLIVLAALLAKTLIAAQQEKLHQAENSGDPPPTDSEP